MFSRKSYKKPLYKINLDNVLNKSTHLYNLIELKKQAKRKEKDLHKTYKRLGKVVYDEIHLSKVSANNKKVSDLYQYIEEHIEELDCLNEKIFTYTSLVNLSTFESLDDFVINIEDLKDISDIDEFDL